MTSSSFSFARAAASLIAGAAVLMTAGSAGAYTSAVQMRKAPPDAAMITVNPPEPRVDFPEPLLRYVYRVISFTDDHYAVQVSPGFVGPAASAAAIAPLCAARGKTAVGHRPARVVLGGEYDYKAALSYSVTCEKRD